MNTCSGRKGVRCEREATESEDRCVFHSELEGKDAEPFEQAIEEIRQGGGANWSGWVIPIECNFEDVTFTQDSDFGEATFTQDASFKGATFTKNADFRDATFAQPARFRGATFAQDANFRRATFSQLADFEDAAFSQDANFGGTTFAQRATFYAAVFTQFADFGLATFAQRATFYAAVFTQFAYFGLATFAQRAYFTDATFTQDASFTGVTFTQDTSFISTTFAQDASFMATTFAQSAYFMSTTFKRSVWLTAATVKGRVTLENCELIDQSSFASTDVSRMTFRRCKLRGAVFADSHNLHEATFDRCTWGKWAEGRLGWLSRLPPVSIAEVVWEETQAREGPTPGVTDEKEQRDWFGEAEVVYREVRWSLESRKNFQQADQFAVREMEMRRLTYLGTPDSSWWDRFCGEIRANLLSIPGAYHLFGNYGQSMLLPIFWIFLLVMLLGPLILICTDTTVFPATFPGYSEAVLRTLRTVALLPDLPIPQGSSLPATPEAGRQVAEVFFRLAGPFFALLFVIAVRRRVRR